MLEFAVAGVAFFGYESGAFPWLDVVLDADQSGHGAGPTTVAMWIEEVGVGQLQVALGAGAGRGQGPATRGTAEEKDVSEFLSCLHGASNDMGCVK